MDPFDDFLFGGNPSPINFSMIPEHWAVRVEIGGNDVLTISDSHLGGEEMTDEYMAAIANAAEHLASFVGHHYRNYGAEDFALSQCKLIEGVM